VLSEVVIVSEPEYLLIEGSGTEQLIVGSVSETLEGIYIEPELLVIESTASEVLAIDAVIELLEVGIQGPPGSPGNGSADQFFQVVNRFYEIAEDETAKTLARSNLGLTTIDGGTFN